MRLSLSSVALSVLAAVALAGPSLAEVPRVATDIGPVDSLVAQVMQGIGTPAQVVRTGASPHDYALRPSEAAALQGADLVVWVGPALEPWLGDALGKLAGKATLLPLLSVPGTVTYPLREGVAMFVDEDEAPDHDHAGGDGAAINPHAWLDPENGKLWLGAIAEALAKADPEHAAAYRANAAAGAGAIDAAEARAKAALAGVKPGSYIVFHDAYQYFETRFGIGAAAAIELGDAAAPGPARIKALRDLVAKGSIACVFTEPEFDPRLAHTVAEGSGAKLISIDPLGSALPAGPGLYPALIGSIAGSIGSCR